ncbi:APE2256 family CRISPR-associated protein [Vulcanisaeta moutnovskia 768-28]|uniref:APE2256 family CRISPR-associated protein n=1 Tax=Vulcanisaeta moutnovskia (strain 768-28) TaxID=985053 RepID=F0QTH5_VULM7|nr:putative CRISPR-associated protein [Vulcanisaeta moutnovskia]ADY01688.1 APE2256 family CRISPR-associated protein [Vulcanisaeta moutnovskia 768-28]
MLRIAILSTVGTSLLGNIERNINRLGLSQVSREVFGRQPSRLSINDELQGQFERWAEEGGDVLEDAVKALSTDPAGFSAELNSIIAFLRSLPARHVINELRLQFYPTDTGTSRFCARAITEYLRRYGNEFRGLTGIPTSAALVVDDSVTLKGFGRDVDWFREGLVDLMDKFVGRVIELRRGGYRVVVNPTGGFKPESAYLTLMAMLAGAWRVIYIHETFREIVELPMLPITIDPRYVDALTQIMKGKGTSKGILQQLGIDVEDLADKELVGITDSEVHVKEWVKKLLEILTNK